MSASISLLRSRRKSVKNLDDSGDESDCSIKDVKKKESIEKDARAIAAINMLTVSMVNKLLEQQGMDPFGKLLGSPSLEDAQSWTSSTKTPSRSSMTRSIKENTLVKKLRKSVRFTPDQSNRSDLSGDRSCESDAMDLTHVRTAPLSVLKTEPKFTPIRRSKALKASMLRSLENELDIDCDIFDSFDSPLPIRTLLENTEAQVESVDDTPKSPVVDIKHDNDESAALNQEVASASSADRKTSKVSSGSTPSIGKSLCEGGVSETEVSVDEDKSDKNDLSLETPVKPKWTHHFDPTSPEHMSPFLKSLLEERAERSQGKSISSDDTEDQQKQSILKGVIAYVEVVRADEDRSSGFRWKLKQLGAQVEENFTKKVTHVVFQEGLLSTYRKAKESNVHLVSAFWVMACDESSSRVPEDKYPIDEEEKYSLLAPLKKYIRRPKLLSPSLGDGDDEKRLQRRLKAIKRRSMKIEGTPSTDSETNETNRAHSTKTNADSKTPLTSKRASIGRKTLATSSGGSSSLMSAWLTGKKKPNAEKECEKTTQVAKLSTKSSSSSVSTSSSRKRTADDSPVKLKTGSFDSPAKTKRTSRTKGSPVKIKPRSPVLKEGSSVDSPSKKKRSSGLDTPTKTELCSRTVDSPAKAKLSSRIVDSPEKKKLNSRIIDSPAKTKLSSRIVDCPAKTKLSSRAVDSLAKTKLSSRAVDSPAKTKLSSRAVDSPAKTKLSSRAVDSPVKTKLSSRTMDSPAKTKLSSRAVDSPAKTKLSSRAVDSPAKTKLSSRAVDAPAKTKQSFRVSESPAKTISKTKSGSTEFVNSPAKKKQCTRNFDSPAKTESSSTSFLSSLKMKLSSKLTDPTNSTSVASPVKSKLGSESSSSPKVTPKKRSAKDDRYLATCSTSAEVSGRVLRSTPKKGDTVQSSQPSFEEGKASLPVSTGKKSLASWFTANKSSPVKRSLSETFTDPAVKPSTSATSTIVKDSSSKEMPDVETPKKKARLDSNDQKEVKPRRPSPKKVAVSKTPKVGLGRSKIDKKKPSPRGSSAKTKCNDKTQTFMTSHFRPLVVSLNKESLKVHEDKNIVAVSVDDCKQTSAQEIDIVTPLVKTYEVIDSEKLTGKTESFAPACVESVPSEESRIGEDSHCPSHVKEERTSADVRQELGSLADSSEEQPIAPDFSGTVDEKPASVNFDEQVDLSEDATGVCEDRNANEEPVSATDVCGDKSVTDDALQEPDRSTHVCEEPSATADALESPIRSADICEDKLVTVEALEEPVKTTDVCEESLGTTDVFSNKMVTDDALEEPVRSADVCEELSATADALEDAFEKSAHICEDKVVIDEALEEPVKTTDVCEEQIAAADDQEEPTRTDCKDKTNSDDTFEEPIETADLCQEQTASADTQEDRTRTDVHADKLIIDDAFGKPVETALCEVQTATADAQEAADVCEDKMGIDDVLEEPVKTTDACEEKTVTADVQEKITETEVATEEGRASADEPQQPVNTAGRCDEQTADALEEPLKITVSCEERKSSTVSLEEQASDALPDKSSGYVSYEEQDGNCDSFSFSQEPSRSENSNESCRKRARKNVKPSNNPCQYRTRRSMRFVSSDVTD